MKLTLAVATLAVVVAAAPFHSRPMEEVAKRQDVPSIVARDFWPHHKTFAPVNALPTANSVASTQLMTSPWPLPWPTAAGPIKEPEDGNAIGSPQYQGPPHAARAVMTPPPRKLHFGLHHPPHPIPSRMTTLQHGAANAAARPPPRGPPRHGPPMVERGADTMLPPDCPPNAPPPAGMVTIQQTGEPTPTELGPRMMPPPGCHGGPPLHPDMVSIQQTAANPAVTSPLHGPYRNPSPENLRSGDVTIEPQPEGPDVHAAPGFEWHPPVAAAADAAAVKPVPKRPHFSFHHHPPRGEQGVELMPQPVCPPGYLPSSSNLDLQTSEAAGMPLSNHATPTQLGSRIWPPPNCRKAPPGPLQIATVLWAAADAVETLALHGPHRNPPPEGLGPYIVPPSSTIAAP